MIQTKLFLPFLVLGKIKSRYYVNFSANEKYFVTSLELCDIQSVFAGKIIILVKIIILIPKPRIIMIIIIIYLVIRIIIFFFFFFF